MMKGIAERGIAVFNCALWLYLGEGQRHHQTLLVPVLLLRLNYPPVAGR